MRRERRIRFGAAFVWAAVVVLSPYVPGIAQELPKGWTAEVKRVTVGAPGGDAEKDVTYYTNSIGMKFVLVPAGEFMMGSSEDEWGREPEEGPLHRVRISRGFYMGAHEVTNAQYREFDGRHNSASHEGHDLNQPNQPVGMVTWDQARAFCEWLSKKEGLPYRLPTEAGWEYACRAGSTTPYWWGEDKAAAGRYANVADRVAKRQWKDWAIFDTDDGHAVNAPVGSYLPNAFGLYDMIGNALEWCEDWYDAAYYASSPRTDPAGPPAAEGRTMRGGSFRDMPRYCRSAVRFRGEPSSRSGCIGFRVVCGPRPTPSQADGRQAATARATERGHAPPPLPNGWRTEAQRVRVAGPDAQVEKEATYCVSPLDMRFVWMPPGEFLMGRDEGPMNEQPAHPVEIPRGFFLAAHEVAQRHYEAVTGQNPSTFRGADRPVENVSHEEAKSFCEKLSAHEGVLYRLPTEAEWEYACRAGTQTLYSTGNAISTALANLDLRGDRTRKPETARGTAAIGSFPANPWGLYDLHGNVGEWCEDWYEWRYYARSPRMNPTGPNRGELRVWRGGSWASMPSDCSSTAREGAMPEGRLNSIGFRLVYDPRPTAEERKVDEPPDAVAAPALLLPRGRTVKTERVRVTSLDGHIVKPITYHVNSIGMKLVLIPAGEFMMGSPADETKREDNEGPLHRVRISQPFLMAACEVTQMQYQAIMRRNPSQFRGHDLPVEGVPWHEAQEFCRRLSEKEGMTYRLPTEAEWEYACRAGTTKPFHFGETLCPDWASYNGETKHKYANGYGEIPESPTEAGSFSPNLWGLHDMHGNVAEWCEDWYDAKYYASSPTTDPRGPKKGTVRVWRGGSFADRTQSCRSAARGNSQPREQRPDLGFRVVCELKHPNR